MHPLKNIKQFLLGTAAFSALLGLPGLAGAAEPAALGAEPAAQADGTTPLSKAEPLETTAPLHLGHEDLTPLARATRNGAPPQAATVTGSKRFSSDGRTRLVLRGSREPSRGGSRRDEQPRQPLSRVMHSWPVRSVDSGPTLLFSDSPEYPDRSGILYRDTVRGDARVLYYHVNRTGTPKNVAVVLENVGAGTAMVTVSRGALSRPSPEYMDVGKETQALYFDDQRSHRFFLKKGEAQVLDAQMLSRPLAPEDLVYGVYDFNTSQKLRVSVVFCPTGTDPASYARRAEVLPADEQHLRGTFQNADRTLRAARAYDPDEDGIVYFLLADNERDPYRWGTDATDGSRALNYGNYGILYRLDIPVEGQGKTQFYLSPFGGMYAGALRAYQRDGKERLLLTPPDTTYFGNGSEWNPGATAAIDQARSESMAVLTDGMELADLGRYDAHTSPDFEFSPPGASNLPAAIIMLPAE